MMDYILPAKTFTRALRLIGMFVAFLKIKISKIIGSKCDFNTQWSKLPLNVKEKKERTIIS